jgi:hypothetical protein
MGLPSVVPLAAMLSKFLLALAVLFGVYWVTRARWRAARQRPGPELLPRSPLIPVATVRTLAYGLLITMVSGSLLWFYFDWEEGRKVVSVQVINTNTGAIVVYQARRADMQGRQFTTLDGRRVFLAEVERLVLE